MACRLTGAKPLSEPKLEYCQLDPSEQYSVKYQSKFIHFHSRKCIWNVVWKLATILPRPQWVKAFKTQSLYLNAWWRCFDQSIAPHIGWASLNPWPDHFCWNMLSYSGLATRLHCPHSRFPRESHMSEQPLFSQVVFQWLCNQMQSAWGVAAVKLWTF